MEVNTPESNQIAGANVRTLATKILNRVERTDAYLEKLLDAELKNNELSGVDKSLLFELVHGVIRYLGRIDWILNGFFKGQYSKLIPNVKNSMRIALYQILFLDKIPDYAAVNEAVEFVKQFQGQKFADITNGVLRNIVRNKTGLRFPDENEDIVAYLSTFYSHPVWLVKRWLNRFGPDFTKKLLEANNEKPSITLRVNKLVTNSDELKELLNKVELKFTEGLFNKDFLKLKNLTNIVNWEYFSKGYFSINDESTGFPCILLDPQENSKVLDLCAAPGGKTAYLADLMNNSGEIYAFDKFESRLEILDRNLKRLGVKNVQTIKDEDLDNKNDFFDRVLIDAPCSGTGTLSKKPDIRWKKELSDIHKLNEIQLELLARASKLVKIGGYIVYSTCSIEKEENSELIIKFLNKFKNFSAISAKGLLPDDILDENGSVNTFPNVHNMDGSFAVKLKREF